MVIIEGDDKARALTASNKAIRDDDDTATDVRTSAAALLIIAGLIALAAWLR